jgi:hypothetical protein
MDLNLKKVLQGKYWILTDDGRLGLGLMDEDQSRIKVYVPGSRLAMV